ncbi:Fibrillarin-like rRNA/tRNA 2'-O-methyltransferase [uncultured archaeon]|nr:Fibrillarin-like rRNA/tRNA 2'-O-methyltransferase [uncultured archaeon]
MRTYFPGVFEFHGRPATKNSVPGLTVYGERTFKQGGVEYRAWDPFRSKVAAGIVQGLRRFPVTQDSTVLYLGASTGTTASHIADITRRLVYCVEFSPRMLRELVPVAERKTNMVPILADARQPQEYRHLLSKADVIIQDVAQPNQTEILTKNMETFGAKAALLSIKARSINSVRDPQKIFKEEVNTLRGKFNVLEVVDLRPFEEDHVLVNLTAK